MAGMMEQFKRIAGGGKAGGSKIMGGSGMISNLARKIVDKKGGKQSKSSGGTIRKAMTKMRKGVDSPVRAAMEGAERKKRRGKGYGLAGGSDK